MLIVSILIKVSYINVKNDRCRCIFSYLYTEILETISSSSPIPVAVMTTAFTTTQTTRLSTVSTTVGQRFPRSTTVHHTSSVSSLRPTTTSVNSTTQLLQLSQGVLMDKLHYTYIINHHNSQQEYELI